MKRLENISKTCYSPFTIRIPRTLAGKEMNKPECAYLLADLQWI